MTNKEFRYWVIRKSREDSGVLHLRVITFRNEFPNCTIEKDGKILVGHIIAKSSEFVKLKMDKSKIEVLIVFEADSNVEGLEVIECKSY